MGIRYCSWVGAQDVLRSLGILQLSNTIHLTGLRLHQFNSEASTEAKHPKLSRDISGLHDHYMILLFFLTNGPFGKHQFLQLEPRKGTYHHSDGLRAEGKDLLRAAELRLL